MLPNILLNFRGCTEIFSSLDPFPVFSLVEYFYTPCIFKALCEHKMKNMQMIDNRNQERKKVSEKEGRRLVCSHRRRVCAFSKLIYKMLRHCCQPPCPLRAPSTYVWFSLSRISPPTKSSSGRGRDGRNSHISLKKKWRLFTCVLPWVTEPHHSWESSLLENRTPKAKSILIGTWKTELAFISNSGVTQQPILQKTTCSGVEEVVSVGRKGQQRAKGT